MNELGDRLLLLIVAAVGLGGFLVAIVGGFVMADLGGTTQYVVIAVLAVLVLATLVGIWFEFGNIDREWA